VEAEDNNLGIWKYMEYTLLPMELRYLTRREHPPFLFYCCSDPKKMKQLRDHQLNAEFGIVFYILEIY